MTDMPGLDFGLGEMADTIRDTTQRFAADKIAPIAAEIDEKDEFPKHLWPHMGELGLHGITVEEEYGGLGLGYPRQRRLGRRRDECARDSRRIFYLSRPERSHDECGEC